MSEFNYELDDETKVIIMELYQKAKSLGLGNIHFKYYATSKSKEVDFYLTEYKFYWELIVLVGNAVDVYKIENDVMRYELSERH